MADAKGRSLWIARPANAFPRVSWSAKPTTTAPTADVVRAALEREGRNNQQHADHDRVLNDCRESMRTRSAPSGLISEMTSRLTSRVNARRSNGRVGDVRSCSHSELRPDQEQEMDSDVASEGKLKAGASS